MSFWYRGFQWKLRCIDAGKVLLQGIGKDYYFRSAFGTQAAICEDRFRNYRFRRRIGVGL